MLIARLIADSLEEGTLDLDARVDELLRYFERPFYDSAYDSRLRLKAPEVVWPNASDELIELRFEQNEAQLAYNVIERHFPDCDALVCGSETELPKLFVSDMDSTMIGQECIDELADFAGLKEQISDITERAMQGELDFEDALKERVALLAGLGESAIDRCLKERIVASPGAKTLCATLHAHGCRNVLVTGGFHHFADRVGEELGFDRVVGNSLDVEGGKLTGLLHGDIVDSNTKKQVLIEEAAKLGKGVAVLAAGDGANDVPMLEVATYGFAYRAKPKARAAANGRVDRGDLTAILTLLGIDRKDWVEG